MGGGYNMRAMMRWSMIFIADSFMHAHGRWREMMYSYMYSHVACPPGLAVPYASAARVGSCLSSASGLGWGGRVSFIIYTFHSENVERYPSPSIKITLLGTDLTRVSQLTLLHPGQSEPRCHD